MIPVANLSMYLEFNLRIRNHIYCLFTTEVLKKDLNKRLSFLNWGFKQYLWNRSSFLPWLGICERLKILSFFRLEFNTVVSIAYVFANDKAVQIFWINSSFKLQGYNGCYVSEYYSKKNIIYL